MIKIIKQINISPFTWILQGKYVLKLPHQLGPRPLQKHSIQLLTIEMLLAVVPYHSSRDHQCSTKNQILSIPCQKYIRGLAISGTVILLIVVLPKFGPIVFQRKLIWVIFSNLKTLLSQSLTGNFPIKSSTSRDNCESRAW